MTTTITSPETVKDLMHKIAMTETQLNKHLRFTMDVLTLKYGLFNQTEHADTAETNDDLIKIDDTRGIRICENGIVNIPDLRNLMMANYVRSSGIVCALKNATNIPEDCKTEMIDAIQATANECRELMDGIDTKLEQIDKSFEYCCKHCKYNKENQ